MLTFAVSLMAEPVFVANFNGSGEGTGGPEDLVQLGGTGILRSNQIVTTAIESEPAMGAGSYLKVTTPDWPTVGLADAVTFTPASKEHSWAAMMDFTSGKVTMDGAFDFFVRPESTASAYGTNWFRPLDIGNPSGGNVRLVLNTIDDGRLMVSLISGQGAFTVDGIERNQVFVALEYPLTDGAVYHLGVSFATNEKSGAVTMSLFIQSGDGPMKADYANGSKEFTINPDVVATGLPSGSFSLKSGVYGPDLPTRVIDYDSFRLYDSVPDVFPGMDAH